jgi:hypothetical protein
MEAHRTRLALLASLGALALALLGAAPARAALPPQGIYDQCAPNSTTVDCGEHLQTIAGAGFESVLNYTAWYGSADEVLAFADQASAAGLKVIWPLNAAPWRDGTDLVDHYRYLGPDCDCDSNAEFKQFALGLVKDHPATWGFYIGDELVPTAQNVSQVSALANEVKQIAPGKPTMFVQLPRQDLAANLEPFLGAADHGLTDYYPIGMEPSLKRFPSVASGNRALTSAHGKGSGMVLQAFSWEQYYPTVYPGAPFPTRAEMLKMRDLAITHGQPGMLLWYAYNDVLDSSDPAGHWADVKAAAFAPHIQMQGLPSRCARPKAKLAVKVRADSRLRQVKVSVDGRVMRKSARTRLGVPLRNLSGGRHTVRVVATDRKGKRAKLTAGFRRCR